MDDDPTAVQTMHDIYVLTDWSLELLREAFGRPDPLFYILTNTRAYPPGVAVRINRTIARNVQALSRETGIGYLFISRGSLVTSGTNPRYLKWFKKSKDRMVEIICTIQAVSFDSILGLAQTDDDIRRELAVC